MNRLFFSFLLVLMLPFAAVHAALDKSQASSLYTATILGDGSVRIDFNTGKCKQVAETLFGTATQNPSSATVKGIQGKAVELLQTNLGPDFNPMLIIRTQVASSYKVFLLSIADILLDGDMTAGEVTTTAPVKNATNSLREKTMREVGTVAEVLTNKGWVQMKGSQSFAGYYKTGSLQVTITRDYGIRMDDTEKGYHKSGTFNSNYDYNFDRLYSYNTITTTSFTSAPLVITIQQSVRDESSIFSLSFSRKVDGLTVNADEAMEAVRYPKPTDENSEALARDKTASLFADQLKQQFAEQKLKL